MLKMRLRNADLAEAVEAAEVWFDGLHGSLQGDMRATPNRTTRRHRRRADGDRGAVIVELAFTLPFLVAILFGIIDFGYSFNDWISVRQGGRDGLRQLVVSTKPTGTFSCGVGVGPLAPASGTDGYKIMCYTKSRIGLDPTKTRVKVYMDPTTIINGKLAAGQPIKMCVQYQTSSLTGAYSSILSNKVLDTEVETLNEQDITTTANGFPFEETGLIPGPKPWPD